MRHKTEVLILPLLNAVDAVESLAKLDEPERGEPLGPTATTVAA